MVIVAGCLCSFRKVLDSTWNAANKLAHWGLTGLWMGLLSKHHISASLRIAWRHKISPMPCSFNSCWDSIKWLMDDLQLPTLNSSINTNNVDQLLAANCADQLVSILIRDAGIKASTLFLPEANWVWTCTAYFGCSVCKFRASPDACNAEVLQFWTIFVFPKDFGLLGLTWVYLSALWKSINICLGMSQLPTEAIASIYRNISKNVFEDHLSVYDGSHEEGER